MIFYKCAVIAFGSDINALHLWLLHAHTGVFQDYEL